MIYVHVAGGYHAPQRGDSNLWLAEVFLLESRGVEHRPTGRLLDSVYDS